MTEVLESKSYAKHIEIKNFSRNYTEDQKRKFETDLKKKYEEEKKLVRGRFLCFEPRGGSVTFVYRKYKWEHPVQYTFQDGEEYEIPLGVARHLNGIDITAKSHNGNIHTCAYPVHAYKTDTTGKPSVDVGKHVRRYAFQTISGEAVA